MLETSETNLALNPYELIGASKQLNSTQREYFGNLETSIKSKVGTLAANLHTIPSLLDAVTYQIEQGNTFYAETMMMQVVDNMKRVRLDETKLEYYEAIHAYITLLSQSEYGNYIDATKLRVE